MFVKEWFIFRQGLSIPARRKSSLEDIGLGALSHPSNHNPIKIALNGSIGLEVTPPEEGGSQTSASNTGILEVGLPPLPILSTPGLSSSRALGSGLGGSMGGLYDPPSSSSVYQGSQTTSSTSQLQGAGASGQDPQHIQGTIVWYNLMWGRRFSGAMRNKWL